MAKPVVDRLEQELAVQVQVLRLSVTDDVGGQLAARYAVRSVPTFVLLNGAGEAVFRQTGVPDRDEITATIRELVTK